MNRYNIIRFTHLVVIYSLFTATAFSQQNKPDVPEQNIFDVAIGQVPGLKTSLAVTWFPPAGMDNFVIEVHEQISGETRQLFVTGRNFVEVADINPNNDYTISVSVVDAKNNIIAHSPDEKWPGKQNREILRKQAFATSTIQSQIPALNVTLISLESNAFPFIFTTIKVDTGGKAVQGLTSDNFKIFEDSLIQTDFFEVTPVNGGNNRIVDFIFLVDNSGSMSPKHKSVKANIRAFIDSLSARNIDVRLGAVRFGQRFVDGQPILMNNGNMTDDIDFFKGLFDEMTDDGTIEPGIEAVYQAATSFSFRPGSQRHFLLITDEDSDGGDLTQTINVCNNNGITVHVAVDTTVGTTNIDYSGPNSIRDATHGELFDVMGPYKKILSQIDEAIRSTYIVRYRTLNDIFNAQQREVRIEVNAFEQSDFITAYYTPGAAPRIQRTQATIDLSNSAKIAGTPLTIEARITDEVAPFIQSATVFYRTSNSAADYTSMLMTLVGDHTYEATIPDTAVITPGVDYYLTATDGQATFSDPAVDPGTFPYQIAVLPNHPPQITYTPVTTGRPGEDILISAAVVDSTEFLEKVELYYREIGMLLYQTVLMTSVGESIYEGIIPGNVLTRAGVEYYIRAVDNLGLASTHGVHTIFPKDCISVLSDDFSDGDAYGWIPNDSLKWAVEQVNGNFTYCLKDANSAGDEYSILPINWKNFVLTLDAQAADNKNFFIIFGVKTFTNCTNSSYYLSFSNIGVELIRSFAADSVVTVASAADDFVSDGQIHRIQITRQFPNIEVNVDGQILFAVNDETFSEGFIGIGAQSSQACFDNVNITGEECASQIYATITIPSELEAETGGTLTMPVIVSSRKDIVLAQFTIEYDGNNLQFDSSTTGPDVPEFTVSQLSLNPPFTTTTPGTNQNVMVQISGNDSHHFSGNDKVVLTLVFSIIGDVENTSPLAIDTNYNHTFLTTSDSEDIFSEQLIFSHGEVKIVAITDVETPTQNHIPTEFALAQNYPNPFNPETTIEFQLPKKSRVDLRIYNLMGQQIAALVNEVKDAGIFRVNWDGKDSSGSQVSSGIYVYQIKTGDYVQSRKLILMR